jgi:hypothetical protein
MKTITGSKTKDSDSSMNASKSREFQAFEALAKALIIVPKKEILEKEREAKHVKTKSEQRKKRVSG